MQRWGYVVFEPDPSDARPKPPHADWLVRPTRGGRRAAEIWQALFGVVEERWEGRFGRAAIGQLEASLAVVSRQLPSELPDCMPILGNGLYGRQPRLPAATVPGDRANATEPTALLGLLSRVLNAFALEFDAQAAVSLAMSADVLRVVPQDGVRLRDLPRLSGVSREAITVALGYLQRKGMAVIEPDAMEARTKVARLTPKGAVARDAYAGLATAVEARWEARFGRPVVADLRAALEHLVGDGATTSLLFRGLEPYPEGWRASVPRPETLPHFPMVTHRGGYPDGS